MIFSIIWAILSYSIFLYLFYISIYNFLLSIAGLKGRIIIDGQQTSTLNRILVLIPCYKDQGVILETARKAMDQDYPKQHYKVVVIADSIPGETVEKLRRMPVHVKEVAFEKSTKVRALNKALEAESEPFDALVILDADNLMERSFLTKFNAQLSKGSKIIQGQRLPKNSNTELAILDGLSEKINNHVFRKGSNNLGLSSSIAGSAFGGVFELIKGTLKGMDSVGGFDKELEILLLMQGFRTEYYENLVVFEEKVEENKIFQNQRKRWISSQYFYFRKYFAAGLKGLLMGRFSLFNSTILRNFQLPRLLNLGLLPVIALYGYFLGDRAASLQWWVTLIGLYVLSFIFALPRDFYSGKGVSALMKLPGIFLIMLKLLFKMQGANTKFIHTPKGINK